MKLVAKLTLVCAFLGSFQTHFVSAMMSSQESEFVEEKASEIAPEITKLSHDIWSYAEVGFLERKSSYALQKTLEKNGFTIVAGIAEMPTAFVASYGSGKPIIAVMGEFDALPQLSQQATPEKKSANALAGHACGHNLLGAGSVAASLIVKQWLSDSGRQGTIRFYGAPAEEGGSGKVYMARAGYFDDVDVVLHWHPGDENNSNNLLKTLAVKSAKFRFHGIAAHAAGTPEEGRSALDAIEAMDYMANLMREHVPDSTRIHYVITNGGGAPNVVPEFAESYYYVRSPDVEILNDVWGRLVKAAEGAALGTGTTMDYEIIGGTYSLLANLTLTKTIQQSFETFGGVTYDLEELDFAKKIQSTLTRTNLPKIESAKDLIPFRNDIQLVSGSTDVGDISWLVPTAGMNVATWVPGTSFHSWQAVAASGMSIGQKGMMQAGKTLALTAIKLFLSPTLMREVKNEWKTRRGENFKYKPLLGDREPALDYRKKYVQ